MKNKLVSLFHAQVYTDAWEDYQRSLHRSGIACWDYIILTASNEQQAAGFRTQIRERMEAGLLPPVTHFAVLPDPDGKRVGSGGATLNVLRYIAERENSSDFKGLRILVIHSGGDSKRIPQYSALGKLFSPVPRELPNGNSSTLFDEFLISMSGIPSRIREGMLLLSGDVLLLFNPLLVDYSGGGAAALSFKEHVDTGKNHGVYLRGADGCVARCLQKQSVQTLRTAGAVNEDDHVDIDTGAVIFSPEILASLYELVSVNGIADRGLFDTFVNEKVHLNIAMFGHKRVPSREGDIEIVMEELASRMVAEGHSVTCYNYRGHHVSGSEFDGEKLSEYKGIKIKAVPTINRKGLAAMTSSFFAAVKAAFGHYDIVHIHAEGPAAMCGIPKLFGKRVIVTIHSA